MERLGRCGASLVSARDRWFALCSRARFRFRFRFRLPFAVCAPAASSSSDRPQPAAAVEPTRTRVHSVIQILCRQAGAGGPVNIDCADLDLLQRVVDVALAVASSSRLPPLAIKR